MNKKALRKAHEEANEMAEQLAGLLEGREDPISLVEVAEHLGLEIDRAEFERDGIDLTVYPIRVLPWFYWFPWRWWWCWWWHRRYPYYRHPWAWCWCRCYYHRYPWW